MTENLDIIRAHENSFRVLNYSEKPVSGHTCSELQKAYEYHFSVAGSQTRKKLALETAARLGVRSENVTILADVVETLHNASLIQDDLQDNSTHRRGQPTVASRFGADVAIGLVNILISQVFATIAKISPHTLLLPLIQNIQSAIAECVHGQTSELIHRSDPKTFQERIDQATAKSGPLFALALELPLICAGKSEYVEDAREASCQFGLAYQLIDDLKDFKLDELQNPGTNIFAALVKEQEEQTAIHTIKATANDCLVHSAHLCSILPFESGKPLRSLVEKLRVQLNSFDG